MKKLLGLFFLLISTVTYSQNECDGVNIVDVFIHPTDQSILMIRANNTGEEIFSYPGFRVYVDDLLYGEEAVVYFGLQGESFHLVNLDEPITEDESYDFTLELWTGFYGSQACVFEYTGVPYDASDCFEGYISMQLFEQGSETVQVSITDQNDNIVLQNTVQLDLVTPIYSESLCLERGCFSIEVLSLDATISVDLGIYFMTEYYQWWGDLIESGQPVFNTTLDIWDGCLLNIDNLANAELNVYPNPVAPGMTIRTDLLPSQIKSAQLFDLQGRLIEADLASAEWKIEKEGFYLMVIEGTNGRLYTERVVVRI